MCATLIVTNILGSHVLVALKAMEYSKQVKPQAMLFTVMLYHDLKDEQCEAKSSAHFGQTY